MSENKNSSEVSLRDLVRMAVKYRVLLISLPLMAGLAALLWTSFVIKPKWEASATLDIGRVGGDLVEPAALVALRVGLPSFVDTAMGAVDGVNSDDSIAIRQSLRSIVAEKILGTELVSIKVRAPSADLADKAIKACIDSLRKTHDEMMFPSLNKDKEQLKNLNENIQQAKADVEELRKKLFATHNWNSFDATLAASSMKDKFTEIREMVKDKLVLDEILSPVRSHSTRTLGAVKVSSGPVWPNKRIVVPLAILLGLMGAVVIAFVYDAITIKPEK